MKLSAYLLKNNNSVCACTLGEGALFSLEPGWRAAWQRRAGCLWVSLHRSDQAAGMGLQHQPEGRVENGPEATFRLEWDRELRVVQIPAFSHRWVPRLSVWAGRKGVDWREPWIRKGWCEYPALILRDRFAPGHLWGRMKLELQSQSSGHSFSWSLLSTYSLPSAGGRSVHQAAPGL